MRTYLSIFHLYAKFCVGKTLRSSDGRHIWADSYIEVFTKLTKSATEIIEIFLISKLFFSSMCVSSPIDGYKRSERPTIKDTLENHEEHQWTIGQTSHMIGISYGVWWIAVCDFLVPHYIIFIFTFYNSIWTDTKICWHILISTKLSMDKLKCYEDLVTTVFQVE